MNTVILILGIISFILSCFSIFAVWKFAKYLKLSDDNMAELGVEIDKLGQLLGKALKKDLIDKDGELKKTYTID